MVRAKQRSKPPTAAPGKAQLRQLGGAERSAYFARREAAKVLRSVLQGDSRRQAVGSIKSLVFGPSVRNKKATFALVCETLKRLPIIKNVLESARVLSGKWKCKVGNSCGNLCGKINKPLGHPLNFTLEILGNHERQVELVYVVTYDVLFGQLESMAGDAEKYIMLHKDALKSGLEKLLLKKKVKSLDDLTALYQAHDIVKPRYVRVNTLKMDLESAMLELGKKAMVKKDDLIRDLLILPPNTDLHDHPFIIDGSLFMQGKGSCMVAAALNPQPDWKVLDACSAPGNKTVHLAALMKGKGKIIACELNKDRVLRLQQTVQLSGASNIQVLHGDFLKLNPSNPPYSKIRGILLDPSCSGSGTTADRLDHLLPSFGSADTASDTGRLYKLAAFQKKALTHALSFPAVERVVYSTCSIHQIENEDVVESVLSFAESHGFHLATLFPGWPRRGLPTFEGSENVVRLDPTEDKEGFFIALFVRSDNQNPSETQPRDIFRGRRVPCLFTKLSRMTLLYPKLKKTRRTGGIKLKEVIFS